MWKRREVPEQSHTTYNQPLPNVTTAIIEIILILTKVVLIEIQWNV